jgi:CelD/BcsL family acetyltransferase involved in cellulose biosynthesis
VDLSSISKATPYIQRLVQDAKLRENVRTAYDSTRSAYERLTNGKAPAKALLEDKKLQRDLQHAVEALRDATTALSEAPKKRARKGFGLGRKLMIASLGFGLALAGSEKLRTKVLDAVFGKEEEFEYTPPPSTASTPPSSPVGAA